MSKFSLFFCINILITNTNPSMRQLLLQITVWEVKGARNGETVHDQGAWEQTGKVCKASLQGSFFTIYEKSIFEFFINYEKTALQIFFFTSQGCSLVVNGETDNILGMVVRVSFP